MPALFRTRGSIPRANYSPPSHPTGINCERINAPFAIPDENDDSLFRASVCFHPRVVIGSRTRFRDERERGKSISGGRGIIPTDSPRVAMVVRSGSCTIIPGILFSREKKLSSLVDLLIISSTIDCLFPTILKNKNLTQFSNCQNFSFTMSRVEPPPLPREMPK